MEVVKMIRCIRYERLNKPKEQHENKDQKVSSKDDDIKIETERHKKQWKEWIEWQCGWKNVVVKMNDN